MTITKEKIRELQKGVPITNEKGEVTGSRAFKNCNDINVRIKAKTIWNCPNDECDHEVVHYADLRRQKGVQLDCPNCGLHYEIINDGSEGMVIIGDIEDHPFAQVIDKEQS